MSEIYSGAVLQEGTFHRAAPLEATSEGRGENLAAKITLITPAMLFWNGSRPPYGYVTVEAERRGARAKKKLAIDPVEAEQVRFVFKLYLEGHNSSGPMGIKAITSWLNVQGYTTRTGGRWGTGRVHALLSDPVYAGRRRFNVKDSKTYRLKPASEHIYCDAPAIISQERFDRVQALLMSRNPRVTPPRVVTGPTLLTGLAVCASCGGT